MNQSESFVDFFRPWYDFQSSIDIKFLNYSGNVYLLNVWDEISTLYLVTGVDPQACRTKYLACCMHPKVIKFPVSYSPFFL